MKSDHKKTLPWQRWKLTAIKQNDNESCDEHVQDLSVELAISKHYNKVSKISENRKSGYHKHANKSGQQ